MRCLWEGPGRYIPERDRLQHVSVQLWPSLQQDPRGIDRGGLKRRPKLIYFFIWVHGPHAMHTILLTLSAGLIPNGARD